jgi:hypothetical protein
LKESYANTLRGILDSHQQSQTIPSNHLVTSNMIRTVYAEVKLNIPFSLHFDLINLLKQNGFNIGVHHYERRSATRIAESI